MDYENLPALESVNAHNRSWSLRRGKRTRVWLDCVATYTEVCHKDLCWGARSRKQRTLRSYRDGSAAKWSRW